MTETLRMVFRNEADRLVAVSIVDPDSTVTVTDIEAVMDDIIAKNIFTTSGGDLVSKVRTEIVSRSVNLLEEF